MESSADVSMTSPGKIILKKPARLWNKNFFLLWQGQLISMLGNQAFLIATIFWLKDATGSASLIGMLLLVAGLPTIILGPIGGTIADHYSRRNIILLGDLLSGVLVLILTGLMFFVPDATTVITAGIFVVALLTGVISAFFAPAISAAIPDLVPDNKVAGANSITQMSMDFALFLGQGLGGILYRMLGAPILFLGNALTFLFSAASEAFITIPQHIPEQSDQWRERLATFTRDLMSGLSYVWNTSGLRGLVLLSSLANFFTAPIIILLPFYVEDFLRLTPDWYGYFIASYSVGSLVGYVLAGMDTLSGNMRSRLTLIGMLLEPLFFIVMVLLGQPFVMLGLAVLAGVMSGFVMINITTIVQITTPGDMRGRVFGLLATIAGSTTPLAAGLAGVVADLLNQDIPLLYLGSSVAIMLVALFMILSPAIRRYLAQTQTPGEQPTSETQAPATVPTS